MTKELRELLNELDTKNKEMGQLLNKKDVTKEELDNISTEIDVLQAKVEAQKKKDSIDNNFKEPQTVATNNTEKVEYNADLFTKAIADSCLKQRNLKGLNLTVEQRNKISENVDEDGGYAVPVDIKTEINRRLKDTTDIFNLVTNEVVQTRSGQRTYEARTEQTTLTNLDEYGKIQEVDNDKLERISFKLHDFAGLMTIPNDLLKFAGEPLKNFLIDWLVDKVRITRNQKILYGNGSGTDVQGIMTYSKFATTTLKSNPTLADFKQAKNVTLDNVFKNTSSWIVNQDGFNYLDTLEDKMGRPYLQPDPKQPTQYLFLGLKVIEIPNYLLKTDTNIPVLLGDLKSAYVAYTDENYELLTTNVGGDAFETNTTKTRVITRLDGTVKDDKAIIKIQFPKGKTE